MTKNTHYELTFIVDGNIPENEHTIIAKKVKDLVLKYSGDIISEIELGRKKLNYPIKKSFKGNYFAIEFNIEAKNIKPIENELKLEKELLRVLIIKKPASQINKPVDQKSEEKEERTEEKKYTPKKEVKKTPIETKEEVVEVEEVKTETTPIEEKEEVIEEVKTEKTKEEPIAPEKDELDQKLDEILNKDGF